MRIRVIAGASAAALTLGVVPAAFAPAAFAATSKPSKPTSVSAASGDKSVTVSWKASVTHGANVTSYQVADRHKSGSHWTAWADKSHSSKARSAAIKGSNGATYEVKVRANSKRGYSAWSSTKTVKIGLPGAVSGVVATNGLSTTAKQIGVSWKAASDHGSSIKSYVVSIRHKSGSKWSGYASKSYKSSVRVVYIAGLSSSGSYQVTVHATNRVGLGPGSTPLAPSLPKVTVLTPGPYVAGEAISVHVAGYPYDQTIATLGFCANDGRVLQGPGDCASSAASFKYPLTLKDGAATTTLTVPTGALGNSSAPAINCVTQVNKCAIVADSIYEFFQTAPVVVPYSTQAMTVTGLSGASAPYGAGQSVKVAVSGFSGTTSEITVALCRGDLQNLQGAGDCATDATALKRDVKLSHGAGSTTITLLKDLGNTTGTAIDCTDSTGVGCSIVAFNADFSQAAFDLPTYANPAITVSPSGAHAAGDTVTVNYTGFRGSDSMVEVAVCRGDIPTSSIDPTACAALGANYADEPSAKIGHPVAGAGSTDLVVPTGNLSTIGGPDYDCQTASDGCVFLVSSFDGQAIATAPVVYSP